MDNPRVRAPSREAQADGPHQRVPPSEPHLLHPLRPLPEPRGNITRQSMTELTCHHDDLAPVMTFMCDEVRQDVRNVQRQVAPDVCLRRRQIAACSDANLEECLDTPATPIESGQQFTPRNRAAIHGGGDLDLVLLTEGLEPRATDIVQVPGNHADRAPRCPGDGNVPEGRREVLHQVRCDAAVGPPGSHQRRTSIARQFPHGAASIAATDQHGPGEPRQHVRRAAGGTGRAAHGGDPFRATPPLAASRMAQ